MVEITEPIYYTIWCRECNRFFHLRVLNTGGNEKHLVTKCPFGCKNGKIEEDWKATK
jgi:phage FluMu protein Com